MARWVLAAAAIVVAILLWRLRSETAAPPIADVPSTAAHADSDDDDRDEPDSDEPPAAPRPRHGTLVASATPAPRPYDPWADPPPVDPRAPHLDVDDPTPTSPQVMTAAFRTALQTATAELSRCYRSSSPTTALEVAIGGFVVVRDGKLVIEPRVRPLHDEVLAPELESCLMDVVASLDLPVPDDGRSFRVVEIVRLTPAPAN